MGYQPRQERTEYVPRDYGGQFKCHYCGQEGHGFRVCKSRDGHIRMGKIKELADGRVALPDGTPLTWEPGKFTLNKVEDYHASKQVEALYHGRQSNSVLQLVQDVSMNNSLYKNKPRDTRDDIIRNLTALLNMNYREQPEEIEPVASTSMAQPRQLSEAEAEDAYEQASRKEREELILVMKKLDHLKDDDSGFIST
jgi:hypothetical protein